MDFIDGGLAFGDQQASFSVTLQTCQEHKQEKLEKREPNHSPFSSLRFAG
jgi:hypothetical protein